MKKNTNKISMTYDPEADILGVEVSDKRIEYATEIGNIIVHFSPDGVPVYFEILEASKFLKMALRLSQQKAFAASQTRP